MLNRGMKIFCVWFLSFGLTACAVENIPQSGITNKYGCTASDQQKLEKQLIRQKISLTRKKNNIFIVIPSNKLFLPRSAQLISKASAILDPLARYFGCYEKNAVRIVAYADVFTGKIDDRALTTAQSKAIMDYLVAKGMDRRMIFVIGGGEPKHIEKMGGENRVEIVTKVLPF